jgi:tryptophan synthase beta chain
VARLLNEPPEERLLGQLPDARGHFGPYGGCFVAETLMGPIRELKEAYELYAQDPEFLAEFHQDLKHYVGRPSPLYLAHRWTKKLGGARIYLKREDLNHTGAHKVNNTVGQALLAKRMGKTRIIAETGAGQHGVATATVATGMRGVHGGRRHSSPGAQRVSNETARGESGFRHLRFEDSKRRA